MASTRVLIEQASAMERNARQYQIVGDEDIYQVYLERRQSLQQAARQLSQLALNDRIEVLITQLTTNEAYNFELLTQRDTGAGAASTQKHRPVLDIAYQLSNELSSWSALQLASIQNETENAQGLLGIQAIVLTFVALLLAALFTTLITRPLVQIETAINQLGSGVYDKNIAISGPEDLVSLGASLDWLRAHLKRLEQQRSSFLRHASHELKTPLAAIQESAALIQDGVAGDINDEQRKLLNILANNGQRLQALIDNLLRYHAEILSVLKAMPHPVRLDKVIEGVLDTHDFVIKSGGLRVHTGLDKVNVSGDAEQLRVIVDNLMTNAIKFSPEQGLIQVNLAQREDAIVLDVIDNGPGISSHEKEKIFEAFYQGAASARGFFKGSGLGLAIVQEYVLANRGSIEVVPCAEGAHFRVRFPT
jgi:two-component system sensor histidine kinase GlrK